MYKIPKYVLSVVVLHTVYLVCGTLGTHSPKYVISHKHQSGTQRLKVKWKNRRQRLRVKWEDRRDRG